MTTADAWLLLRFFLHLETRTQEAGRGQAEPGVRYSSLFGCLLLSLADTHMHKSSNLRRQHRPGTTAVDPWIPLCSALVYV